MNRIRVLLGPMLPITRRIVRDAMDQAEDLLVFAEDALDWDAVWQKLRELQPDVIITAAETSGAAPFQLVRWDVSRLRLVAVSPDGSASIGQWRASEVATDLSRRGLIKAVRALYAADAPTLP